MEKSNYTLKRSARAKYMRLAIYPSEGVVVTAPWGFDSDLIEKFIYKKAHWISKKLKYFVGKTVLKGSKRDYYKNKTQALALATNKIVEWNSFYGFAYNKISIRRQKSRWGSCSKKGNLNFNYKIIYLKPNQLDYLIVHELCHLKEFNHSPKFWALVSQTMPDYFKLKKELKNIIA